MCGVRSQAATGTETFLPRASAEADDMSLPGGRRRTRAVVAGLAVVALAARLAALGDRPFDFGEARVGVWALRFARTGAFEYRPVAGGPLPYHLARAAFALLGPTDAAARLPVALLGGLFPLAALALRGRLSDEETVLLAAVFALSPPLVYYGRVLRGDLLLAAAAFLAVALAVRAVDDAGGPAAAGAAVAAALALAASGFVVATVACVLAGATVALDARRVPAAALDRAGDRLRPGARRAAALLALFVLVTVFLFAPRGGDAGLWDPLSLPAALAFVLVEAPGRFVAVRVVTRFADGATHPLLPFVASLARTLVAAAPVTLAAGVAGALHERYVGEGRPVVTLFTVWAAAGLLVVPAVAEADAPWSAVHVVVPLAVPAAVGLARGRSLLRGAVARGDAGAVAAALLVVVAGVAVGGGVLAAEVYGPPGPDSTLAGYAQPADDLDPFAANVSAAAAATGDDPAVLYYGDRFHTGEWRVADGPPVPTAWGSRLPLPWYVVREGATATSLPSNATLPRDPPPVVVVDPASAALVERRLTDYERSSYRLGLWNREAVVFVRAT
jgi:uncharacterized protein (TIGR03663 family)